jgi:two-component system response regulator DesR
MEPFNGIEVARRAAVAAPDTAIVLYTGYRDHALLQEALDVGARGFVLKDAPLEDVLSALTTIVAGGTYVDADLAHVLASAATDAQALSLTRRERQVLGLLSDGLTNERVAAELGISAETVQSHVRNAMGKLDADTRTEAVATAIRKSLIT